MHCCFRLRFCTGGRATFCKQSQLVAPAGDGETFSDPGLWNHFNHRSAASVCCDWPGWVFREVGRGPKMPCISCRRKGSLFYESILKQFHRKYNENTVIDVIGFTKVHRILLRILSNQVSIGFTALHAQDPRSRLRPCWSLFVKSSLENQPIKLLCESVWK